MYHRPRGIIYMGIAQRLCAVRDREFGGDQKKMAEAWQMNQSTLSRWINRVRVPESDAYEFLAQRLGLSILEVHELCQIDRRERREMVRTTTSDIMP